MTPARSATEQGAAARAAVLGFMDALNRLDVAAMDRHFTDDVTAFVPLAQPGLAGDRTAVTAIFRGFAYRVRSSDLAVAPMRPTP